MLGFKGRYCCLCRTTMAFVLWYMICLVRYTKQKNPTMKRIGYLFGGLLFFAACAQSPKQDNGAAVVDSTAGAELTENDAAGSYTYMQQGDTVSLHLTMQGSKAMGHLTYAWKEKDHNNGSFEGEIKDGILLADYTFQSEGMSSVRQVAFKIDGTTATEGYGDVEEKDGKFVFKDANNLSFDKGLVLSKQ